MTLPAITEPMTAATDAVLGASSIAWGVAILARTEGWRSRRIWGAALVMSGLGAWTGGAWHAWVEALDPLAATALWKVTMLLVGGAAGLLTAGAALASLPAGGARRVCAAAIAQFGVFALVAARTDEFSAVIAQYGLSLLIVAALMIRDARRVPPRSAWIVAGVVVSTLAAAVQALGVAPHPRFNHNDLFHVVQMAAAWCFYRGGLRLEDR